MRMCLTVLTERPGDIREIWQEWDLSPFEFEEAFTPLDFPSHDADALSRMMCTSPSKIKKIRILRRKTARLLSDDFARAVLALMAQNDTVMGYKPDPDTRKSGGKHVEM